MLKLDKRKNYYLHIDTETAGDFSQPLIYDIAGIIHDKQGKVYHKFNFIVQDIFVEQGRTVRKGYYGNKVDDYWNAIKARKIRAVSFLSIYRHIHALLKQYNVTAVMAFNARFDKKALDSTISYLTNGRIKEFFSPDQKIICLMEMAKETIATQKTYARYCRKNNFVSPTGKIQYRAQTILGYILLDPSNTTEHTALEDVKDQIQVAIQVFRQKKSYGTRYKVQGYAN